MVEKTWLPIVLLRYMIDCKMLISLVVSEAIISYRKQTNVWLPEPESLDSIIEESRKHINAGNENTGVLLVFLRSISLIGQKRCLINETAKQKISEEE